MDTQQLVDELADQLTAEIGPAVKARVEKDTRQEILDCKSKDVLTFLTTSGRRYEPSANIDYAKALYHFMRGNGFNGQSLDSAITQPVVDVTERAVLAELNSDATARVVQRVLAPGQEVNSTVRATSGDEAKDAAAFILAQAGLHPSTIAAEQITTLASQNASEILGSASGKAILAGVVQASATTAGKAMLAKIITATASKLAGSKLFKVAVVAGLKKIGALLIIKAVLAKILAAMLPAVVAAKIPIFWVLIPIIGAFIYHEMKSIPRKLAEQLPPKLATEVEGAFPTIARSAAEAILADIVATTAATAKDST